MGYGDFMARVRERGEFADQEETQRVTEAVLGLLGSRLQAQSAYHLADQLPGEFAATLTDGQDNARRWGVEEFLEHAAEATDAPDASKARVHVEAVLATVGETVTGGELNKLISQLPAGYAALFGHPELS